MSTDPRQIIEESAMTRLQYMIIALTVGLSSENFFDTPVPTSFKFT